MRRKSERTANRKTTKASPEKKEKPDKLKRTKTRRRKQSTSSDNNSADEIKPVPVVTEPVVEANPPQTSTKEESPEETNEQVWQVKAAEGGDAGEIQKLKICLTRPPSTPERADRSPRSKRKLSRSASGEPTEDRKKIKHRSKRSGTESKEDADKNVDSQGDEADNDKDLEEKSDDTQTSQSEEVSSNVTTQSKEISSIVTPQLEEVSSNVTPQSEEVSSNVTPQSEEVSSNVTPQSEEVSSYVTPQLEEVSSNVTPQSEEVSSNVTPQSEEVSSNVTPQLEEVSSNVTLVLSNTSETQPEEAKNDSENTATGESTSQETSTENKPETQDKQSDADTTVTSPKSEAEDSQNSLSDKEVTSRKRSMSCEKSEILEIHADESRCESSDVIMIDTQTEETRPESPKPSIEETTETIVDKPEVSIITDDKMESINSEHIDSTGDDQVTTNEPNVVESSKSPEKEIVSVTTQELEKPEISKESNEKQSDLTTSVSHEGTVHNGQASSHSNRKRRWGSRPTRITTQKSITISTDVLKDIIPDVKPVEFDEVIEEKKHRRVEITEKLERPVLPKIVIDNTESVEINKTERDERNKENVKIRESNLSSNRKISIVKDSDSIIARPPSPPRHKQSNILYITNLVRPFTLPQLKNLLQRTGRIVENGFWIDRIKSKCFVQYETEDQAVETRHALHGVTWPVSNPKTLHVDFSTTEDFDKAKANEETDGAQVSTIPGTVEDWLREQDLKRERGELEKPWERKTAMREWDVGKNEKGKEKDKLSRDDRLHDKRRHRTPERSPEPARKFKKKEEEAPAKLLDDLFRKTKATPCIYWLPLSAETIAVKEEQRRQHMAEHERRLQELRRTHRRH